MAVENIEPGLLQRRIIIGVKIIQADDAPSRFEQPLRDMRVRICNCAAADLGCGHRLGVEQHANLAAEQVEQDRDAVAVRHAVVRPEQSANKPSRTRILSPRRNDGR